MTSLPINIMLGYTFFYLPILYPTEGINFNLAYVSTGHSTQNFLVSRFASDGYGCGQIWGHHLDPFPAGVNMPYYNYGFPFPTFTIYNQATDYIIISLDSSSFLPGATTYQCLPGSFASVKIPVANLCTPVAGKNHLLMMDHVAYGGSPGVANRLLTVTPIGYVGDPLVYPLRAPRLVNMELIGGTTFSTWGTNINWKPDAWSNVGNNMIAGSYILIGNPQPTSPNYVGISSVDSGDVLIYYSAFGLPNTYAGDYYCQLPMSLYGFQTTTGYDGNQDYPTYQNYHQCSCTSAYCGGYAYNLFVQENVYASSTLPPTHTNSCTQVGVVGYSCAPLYCGTRRDNGTIDIPPSRLAKMTRILNRNATAPAA